MKRIFSALLPLFIMSILPLQAGNYFKFKKDNKLNVNFELRPRAEYRNGYLFPHTQNDMPMGFVVNRTRLSFNYLRKGLSTKLSIQNVGVWGENPVVNTKQNVLIHEAWAKLASKEGVFLQIGRQALHYDDGRLLSASNWNQYGRTHDVLKLGYEDCKQNFELFFAYNQDRVKNVGGTYYAGTGGIPYKTMQGLYYKNSSLKGFTPSLIFINLGYDMGSPITGVSDVRYMQTFGTNLIYQNHNFMLHGIGYYQMSKISNVEDISAFLVSLKGKYNLHKKISITLGTDYLSGEDANEPLPNKTYNAFNVLYSGNHGLYGVMDNYIDAPYINGMALGVWDKYMKINYLPTEKLTLTAGYNHLSMAADMYDAATNTLVDKYLGSEVSLLFDYKIMKDVSLSCGYAFMLNNKTTELVKGGDYMAWQDWAYVMITIKPDIFKIKW